VCPYANQAPRILSSLQCRPIRDATSTHRACRYEFCGRQLSVWRTPSRGVLNSSHRYVAHSSATHENDHRWDFRDDFDNSSNCPFHDEAGEAITQTAQRPDSTEICFGRKPDPKNLTALNGVDWLRGILRRPSTCSTNSKEIQRQDGIDPKSQPSRIGSPCRSRIEFLLFSHE
jgi:hypothetical protein